MKFYERGKNYKRFDELCYIFNKGESNDIYEKLINNFNNSKINIFDEFNYSKNNIVLMSSIINNLLKLDIFNSYSVVFDNPTTQITYCMLPHVCVYGNDIIIKIYASIPYGIISEDTILIERYDHGNLTKKYLVSPHNLTQDIISTVLSVGNLSYTGNINNIMFTKTDHILSQAIDTKTMTYEIVNSLTIVNQESLNNSINELMKCNFRRFKYIKNIKYKNNNKVMILLESISDCYFKSGKTDEILIEDKNNPITKGLILNLDENKNVLYGSDVIVANDCIQFHNNMVGCQNTNFVY